VSRGTHEFDACSVLLSNKLPIIISMWTRSIKPKLHLCRHDNRHHVSCESWCDVLCCVCCAVHFSVQWMTKKQ